MQLIKHLIASFAVCALVAHSAPISTDMISTTTSPNPMATNPLGLTREDFVGKTPSQVIALIRAKHEAIASGVKQN